MSAAPVDEAQPRSPVSRSWRRFLAAYPAGREHEVTAFELLFDLLVAFAFSQIDSLMLSDPTWSGLVRGVLVLAMLWGCWITFVLAANAVLADQGLVRNAHFAAIVGMVLLGLALPRAFSEQALSARVLIVVASYLAIRGASAVVLRIVVGRTATLRCVTVMLAAAGSGSMLICSAVTPPGWRIPLWIGAMLCELAAVWSFTQGWQPGSADHLSARFGFIIIFCLDMSLGGLVYSMLGKPVTYAELFLVCLALVSGAVIWWMYFGALADKAMENTERAVEIGDQRTGGRLLFVHYSMLHYAALAGMMLYTTGLRAVGHDLFTINAGILGAPVAPLWAFCLTGGVAVYVGTIAAMWSTQRLPLPLAQITTAVIMLALVPVIGHTRALLVIAALVVLSLLMLGADRLLRRPVAGEAEVEA